MTKGSLHSSAGAGRLEQPEEGEEEVELEAERVQVEVERVRKEGIKSPGSTLLRTIVGHTTTQPAVKPTAQRSTSVA